MIQLTISTGSPEELRATAAYIQALALIRATMRPARTIDPEDRPDAGAPPPPAPVFQAAAPIAPTLPDPAAVFGAVTLTGAAVVPIPLSIVPVPPAPVSATPAAPPVAAAPPAGVETDADGLPWDARIHATNRGKNADGRWRQRRGLNDEALKHRIEAELRTALAAPAPVVPAPPVSVANPSPALPVVSTSPAVPASAIPLPPSAPTAPAASTGAAPSPTTMPELMRELTPHMAAGRIDMARVLEACQAAGIPSLAVLGARPDLVPAVWAGVQMRLTVAA